MRAERLTSLVILGLLLLGSGPVFGQGPIRSRPFRAQAIKNPPDATPEKNPTWVVQGWAEKREDAEQFALQKAQEEVVAHFAKQGISLGWVPPLTYIEKLVKSRSSERKAFDEPLGIVDEVSLQVELSSRDVRDILKHDRDQRARVRMMFTGKVLAGLVALFGVVAGYFRLEEATKGYYTAMLRLAAIGFIGAVAALLMIG
jgi:hypothetical protein